MLRKIKPLAPVLGDSGLGEGAGVRKGPVPLTPALSPEYRGEGV